MINQKEEIFQKKQILEIKLKKRCPSSSNKKRDCNVVKDILGKFPIIGK